jgi:hypothetical protein
MFLDHRRKHKHVAVTVLLGVVAVTSGIAQTARQSDSLFIALPNVVRPQVVALGDRVRVPGKEKIILSGQYVDASGNHPAQATYQLPGLVRLDGFKAAGTLAFDGDRSYGAATPTDDAFLETFLMDTAEGMLASTTRGAALRLVGREFRPNPKRFPKYVGPRYDIYELAAPIRSRQDRLVRLKRFYFDSKTGWLVRTRYRDRTKRPFVTVETRFAGWSVVDGSAYPGRIDRYENGQPVFSFVVGNISAGPSIEPASFR